MSARPIDEPHRVSSQLELLFDLTFVVAVAAVTAQFARHIADGHALDGIVPFLQVFFAIWWAWMNFTWFASAFDTDDVAYRLLTMLQMAGVLVLAAGVPAAADDSDFRAVTVGYLIMRAGLVAQWLRAALEDPGHRRTALRYAAAITTLQAGWTLWLVLSAAGVLPDAVQLPIFVVLAIAELGVPRWAERSGTTNWHPHHIAERYGLFTIILLGESVLAAATGVQAAVRTGHIEASPRVVGFAVAVPVATFLTVLWVVHVPVLARPVVPTAVILGSAAVVLLLPVTTGLIGVAGVVATITGVCVLLVATAIATRAGQRSALGEGGG
jgi:low temperature requirement protein LtrA